MHRGTHRGRREVESAVNGASSASSECCAVHPTDDDALHARMGLDAVQSGLNLGRLHRQPQETRCTDVSAFIQWLSGPLAVVLSAGRVPWRGCWYSERRSKVEIGRRMTDVSARKE